MTAAAPSRKANLAAKMWRVWALIRKECRQVVRDPSSFAIGVVLPLMLIVLFGYAMSLNVKHVPLALVLDDQSAQSRDIAASFQLSPYFAARPATSMAEAQEWLVSRRIDGIVRMPSDFARRAVNV